MPGLEIELRAMIAAATLAGEGLVEDFQRLGEIQVVEKGPADLVSAADLRSQHTLATSLGNACPNIAFLGEEGRATRSTPNGRCFVVDPLDGTSNFVHGIPHFAISISLEEDGAPIAGVVLEPVRRELFVAVRGEGATVGRAPLAVSPRTSLRDSIVATGIPHHGRGDHPGYLRGLAAMMRDSGGIRRFGSAALDLAYVAAGRFDVFFESGLARWDISAGRLLVEEAGGAVSGIAEGEDPLVTGNVLATNGHLHALVAAQLRA